MTNDEKKTTNRVLHGISGLMLVCVGIICFFMYGYPHYHVYEQTMAGQAKLKEAESSRQILVQEAHAKEEAAKSLAKAEIERAKGAAEANRIIGDSLKGNEVYLHYLWIHGLQETKNDIIYIPTEANLPILEANRFKMRDDKAKTQKAEK